MSERREKRVGIGPIGVTMSLSERRAAAIRSNPVYRAVKPIVDRVTTTPEQTSGVNPLLSPEPGIPVYFPRPKALPDRTSAQKELVARIAGHQWYHSIDVGNGVATPGTFDHRPALSSYPIPESLAGMRCLDVATFDGFWAFEMERRGAAEVVAIDIDSWSDLDLPPRLREEWGGLQFQTGQGFRIAAEAIGSKVQRKILSVYDLTPERIGTFDFIICSDLLIHLQNPMRAMSAIHSVTRATAMFVEYYAPEINSTGLGPIARIGNYTLEKPVWWDFSVEALGHALRLVGFDSVELRSRFDVRSRLVPEVPLPRVSFLATRVAGAPADTPVTEATGVGVG